MSKIMCCRILDDVLEMTKKYKHNQYNLFFRFSICCTISHFGSLCIYPTPKLRLFLYFYLTGSFFIHFKFKQYKKIVFWLYTLRFWWNEKIVSLFFFILWQQKSHPEGNSCLPFGESATERSPSNSIIVQLMFFFLPIVRG